jgi:hypothetical protein
MVWLLLTFFCLLIYVPQSYAPAQIGHPATSVRERAQRFANLVGQKEPPKQSRRRRVQKTRLAVDFRRQSFLIGQLIFK